MLRTKPTFAPNVAISAIHRSTHVRGTSSPHGTPSPKLQTTFLSLSERRYRLPPVTTAAYASGNTRSQTHRIFPSGLATAVTRCNRYRSFSHRFCAHLAPSYGTLGRNFPPRTVYRLLLLRRHWPYLFLRQQSNWPIIVRQRFLVTCNLQPALPFSLAIRGDMGACPHTDSRRKSYRYFHTMYSLRAHLYYSHN